MLSLSVLPPLLERRIGVAIVGLGQQGFHLLEEMLSLRQNYPLDIIALSDLDPARLDKAAQRVPTALLSPHYESTIAAKGVNAVMIATPDASHALIAERALALGCDLYIEPPLARRSDDVQQLAVLAERHNAVIQLGMHDLNQPLYRTARRIIQSRILGKISRVDISLPPPQWRHSSSISAPFERERFLLGTTGRQWDDHFIANWALFKEFSDGHAVLELCRKAEILRSLMAVEFPDRVTAEGGNFIGSDARTHPDTFHALLTYARGFLVSFSMGLGQDCFRFYGTQGRLDLIERKIVLNTPTTALSSALSADLATISGENSLSHHINNWLAAVQYRQKPRLGMDAVRRQVRLSEAVLKAYEQDKGIL